MTQAALEAIAHLQQIGRRALQYERVPERHRHERELAAAHAERKATLAGRRFFQQVMDFEQHLYRHAGRQRVAEVRLHSGRIAAERHEVVGEELQIDRSEVLALHTVENGSVQLLDKLPFDLQFRQIQRLQHGQHVGQALAVGLQRSRHVVEHETIVACFLRARIARGREECLLTQHAQCPLDACTTGTVQASLACRWRQQLRHLCEIEQRLVSAAERLLQVCRLKRNCRSRIVGAEYRFETQDQRIDAGARSTRLIALHDSPGMTQEPRWQPGIASSQFAIDSQRSAHDLHFTPPGIVGAGTCDRGVPGLQQSAPGSLRDGFPDQALDMQRPLAHRFALRTLWRCRSQRSVDRGCEGDDVLAGSLGEHDGEIVTNQREMAVLGQQGRPQTGRQRLLCSGVVRVTAREMEDDLRPELTVHGYCGQIVNLSNSPSSAPRTWSAVRNLPAPRRSS
jgi:hypothetical protein